ncbi:MAG: Transposase [Candidatus Midichloria mitochondrii]
MQATTHVPKILKKLAETKGTRVWDDAFRSYNDPRFVSFEGITGFKDFYLNCVQISFREELPKLVSYNRFVELMRDAVTPLVILLNCCKGKQTGALTQQKAGRFCHNLRTSRNKIFKGIARQTISWPKPLFLRALGLG